MINFIIDPSRIMPTVSSNKDVTSQKGSTTVASVLLNSSISAGAVAAIVLVLLILTASVIAVLLGIIIIWRKRKCSSQAIVKDQFNGKGVGRLSTMQ